MILLISALIYPYFIAFVREIDSFWLTILTIFDLTYGINMILTFLCAYVDENYNLILSWNKLIKNYLKGWFILDVIGLLPLHLVIVNANILKMIWVFKYFIDRRHK